MRPSQFVDRIRFPALPQNLGDRTRHVVCVHRLEPGGADRSYGIEVGRLAGLPRALLERARELLRRLESEQLAHAPRPVDIQQLGLFAAPRSPLLERLGAVDVNALTPIQALALLDELARAARTER